MKKSRVKGTGILVLSHALTMLLGGSIIYFAYEPAGVVWGFFLGDEVKSQSSFPRHHVARIYSAWGFGEQSLIFVVDGKRVYRINDFAPGNLREQIVWDPTAQIVTFSALGRKIFTYDTQTGIGTVETN